MAVIGLIIVACAIGSLTSQPIGWLTLGTGLVVFAFIDQVIPPKD